jgi:hypothetical protein
LKQKKIVAFFGRQQRQNARFSCPKRTNSTGFGMGIPLGADLPSKMPDLACFPGSFDPLIFIN